MGSLGRKRHLLPPLTPPSVRAAALRLRRLLQRHHLSPLAVVLLVLLPVVAVLSSRLRRPAAATRLAEELRRSPPRYTVDTDLLSLSPSRPALSDLRNATHAHDGLHVVATASGLGDVRLHLSSSVDALGAAGRAGGAAASGAGADAGAARTPRLVDIARAMGLSRAALPGWQTRLPLPLPASVARRDTARAALRAAGFRSASKVPSDASVTARVVAVPDRMHAMQLLHMPAHEPYDWEAVLPSAALCGAADDRHGKRERCRRVAEVMLLSYVGGCAPPADGDLFEEPGGGVAIGVPKGCFASDALHSRLTLDVMMRYVSELCELPTGLVAKLRSLRAISWGVGKRVAKVLQVLEGDEKGTGVCDENAWVFYNGPG